MPGRSEAMLRLLLPRHLPLSLRDFGRGDDRKIGEDGRGVGSVRVCIAQGRIAREGTALRAGGETSSAAILRRHRATR